METLLKPSISTPTLHFEGRKVLASNRGPLAYNAKKDTFEYKPGGLVSAMHPVLKHDNEGGLWVFGNDSGKALSVEQWAYEIADVALGKRLNKGFYEGFANRTLWPIFHSLYAPGKLDKIKHKAQFRYYFPYYLRANQKYATELLERIKPDDTIWIQDYQLLLVPELIRKKRPNADIGFFLHIPFPKPDVFKQIPFAKRLLKGMIANDQIGFQTPRDRDNFLETVQALLPQASINSTSKTIEYKGHTAHAEAYPISIDTEEFDEIKAKPDFPAQVEAIREQYDEEFIGVGIDRLDYTKGIPERLLAFEQFLDENPEYQGRVRFIQIAAKSRESVKEYKELSDRVDQIVERINNKYPNKPVTYMDGQIKDVCAAYMMASDFGIVNPHRDGMNLVAKEYAYVQEEDHPGLLILSEEAGAIHELKEIDGKPAAFGVDPTSIDDIAQAIKQSVSMPQKERAERSALLKAQITENTVDNWQEKFFADLETVAAQKGE